MRRALISLQAPRRRRVLAIACYGAAACLFVEPVLARSPAQQTNRAPPLAAKPAIEWTSLPHDAPTELSDSVQFGYLEVPADHANPTAGSIRVALLLVPGPVANRLPDPVVVMLGGPGLPAILEHLKVRQQGPHRFDIFRQRRDLIILDPRGHGYSGPTRCAELDGREPLSDNSRPAEKLWLDKLALCRRRLLASGVRLETLSSEQVAHDLEWLRRALGAPQLNLVGMSYGSRHAAEAVRQVPAAVRAVYFWGPDPPGLFAPENMPAAADEVLARLLQRCATQPSCRQAYPRLAADLASLLARARRERLVVEVPRSDRAPEGEVVIDHETMQQGFAQLLINRQLAAGAPLLIHALSTEKVGPAGGMARQLMETLDEGGVSTGTLHTFWCNDRVVSAASPPFWRQRCRILLGDGWSDDGTTPVRSSIPALIEAGEFDPRTPPFTARFLAAGFPRSHVVITPWHGHERQPDCSMRIASRFFDAPDRAPNLACMDSIPPLEFIAGVIPSRWVGNSVARIAERPWLLALPGAAALLLLVPAVGLPIQRSRRRRRALPNPGRVQHIALLTLALLGLLLLISLTAAVVAGQRRHFFVPLIGVTRGWVWVLALPWLLLAVTPVAAILMRSARSSDEAAPAALRWSTVGGVMLVLGLWAYNLLA